MRIPRPSLAPMLWIGAASALAVFLVVMMWPRPIEVAVAAIDIGDVRREVVDEGRTRARDVYVVSAPVSGLLKRVTLEPGDKVGKGDVVAAVVPADPALLDARFSGETRAAVAAAVATLRAAEAEAGIARANRDRTQALSKTGFASQAALDRALAASRSADALVKARKAEVERTRAAAGYADARATKTTQIRSPADGKVLRVLQESEAVVAPGTPILEIGDPEQLEVVAEFRSQDAAQMQSGASAQIENWGGDPIPAKVLRIEPYARTKISALGVEEQRVNVVLSLDRGSGAGALGHGFRVDVRVVVSDQADVLRAPTDALVRNGDAWAVFRVEKGRARLTPVMLGEGGEDFRAVAGGLRAGDQVIVFPGDLLKDGARVRPAPTD